MIVCTRPKSPTAGWKPCGWRLLSAGRESSTKARFSVPSTDTTDSSLLQQAMKRPLLEKLEQKSVRLKQATEAALVSDAAAGLAEDRRSTKAYNQQADRATKAMTDKWIKANGGQMPQDDDDTVVTDLGDRYQEIHNHYGQPAAAAGTTQAPDPAKPASDSLFKKIAPVLLAATLGPAAGVLGAWYFNKDAPVNVKDVQSKFKVEVYDETGKLITTLPYDQLPKQ